MLWNNLCDPVYIYIYIYIQPPTKTYLSLIAVLFGIPGHVTTKHLPATPLFAVQELNFRLVILSVIAYQPESYSIFATSLASAPSYMHAFFFHFRLISTVSGFDSFALVHAVRGQRRCCCFGEMNDDSMNDALQGH